MVGTQSYSFPRDLDLTPSTLTPKFTTVTGTTGGTVAITLTFGSPAVGGIYIHEQGETTPYNLKQDTTTGSVNFRMPAAMTYLPWTGTSLVALNNGTTGTVTIEAMYFSL